MEYVFQDTVIYESFMRRITDYLIKFDYGLCKEVEVLDKNDEQ
jgi:hypothetical protein